MNGGINEKTKNEQDVNKMVKTIKILDWELRMLTKLSWLGISTTETSRKHYKEEKEMLERMKERLKS